MDVPLNKTIKSFLEFRPKCPICEEKLVLDKIVSSFREIILNDNIADIIICERRESEYITKVNIDTNLVIIKPINNPYKYINGHFYMTCISCRIYTYRSNYIEYDFYSSIFPTLEVEQEMYYNNDISIVSYLSPIKRSLIYVFRNKTSNYETLEVPYISFASLDLKDNLSIKNKIKRLLVLL